jgi:hypothetical protein
VDKTIILLKKGLLKMDEVLGSYSNREGENILIYQDGDKIKIKGSTFDVPFSERNYKEILKDYVKTIRRR